MPVRIPARLRQPTHRVLMERPWFLAVAGQARAKSGPELLSFAHDGFVDTLSRNVARSQRGWNATTWEPLYASRDYALPHPELFEEGEPCYPARELRRRPPRPGEVFGELATAKGSGEYLLRRLWLPVHGYHHLLSVQLTCERFDRPVLEVKRVCRIGLLTRCLRPNKDRVLWEDWIQPPDGPGLWVSIADAEGRYLRGRFRGQPLTPGRIETDALDPIQEAEVRLRLGLRPEEPLVVATDLRPMAPIPDGLRQGRHAAYFGYLPVSTRVCLAPTLTAVAEEAARRTRVSAYRVLRGGYARTARTALQILVNRVTPEITGAEEAPDLLLDPAEALRGLWRSAGTGRWPRDPDPLSWWLSAARAADQDPEIYLPWLRRLLDEVLDPARPSPHAPLALAAVLRRLGIHQEALRKALKSGPPVIALPPIGPPVIVPQPIDPPVIIPQPMRRPMMRPGPIGPPTTIPRPVSPPAIVPQPIGPGEESEGPVDESSLAGRPLMALLAAQPDRKAIEERLAGLNNAEQKALLRYLNMVPDAATLDAAVPGIGPRLAAAVVEAREAGGGRLANVAEIARVGSIDVGRLTLLRAAAERLAEVDYDLERHRTIQQAGLALQARLEALDRELSRPRPAYGALLAARSLDAASILAEGLGLESVGDPAGALAAAGLDLEAQPALGLLVLPGFPWDGPRAKDLALELGEFYSSEILLEYGGNFTVPLAFGVDPRDIQEGEPPPPIETEPITEISVPLATDLPTTPRYTPGYIYTAWVIAVICGIDACELDQLVWSSRSEPFVIADLNDSFTPGGALRSAVGA